MIGRAGRSTGYFGPAVAALTVFSLVAVQGVAQESTPEYDDVLLDVVLREQGASRLALADYVAVYRVRIDTDEANEDLHNTCSQDTRVKALLHGSSQRVSTRQQVKGNYQYKPNESSRLGPYAWSAVYELAVNHTETACRRARDAERDVLEIWFHTAGGEIHPSARGSVGLARAADIAGYPFSLDPLVPRPPGERDDALLERMSGPGTFHARMIGVGEESMIEITYHRDGKIWNTAWVDPRQGYATVKMKCDTGEFPDGRREKSERSVELEKQDGDIWVPERIYATETLVQPDSRITSTVRIDVDSFELDPETDLSLFAWPALGYIGSEVYVHDENDALYRMSYLGKLLQPAPTVGDRDRELVEGYVRKLTR